MEEILLKLLLAVLVGGLIGVEREFRTGTGLRTLMLICLGATMFTIYSSLFDVSEVDPLRVAAAVVTGVGFLGAGMILRQKTGVFGLTTAASVWLVAALGMGIGLEQYFMVIVATVLVLSVLWLIPLLQRLTNARQTLTYEVFGPLQDKKYGDLLKIMTSHNLRISKYMMSKESDGIKYVWQAYGKPGDHEHAMFELMDNDELQEFHVAR